MVICAGPTGSGKTTTLYATLAEINRPSSNVMTIEDPVEYVFPTINQIQINEQAGMTFATGLKSILRQDPDVILVGEIRDVETARIAVQSALTGHLVLSSLHATDAVVGAPPVARHGHRAVPHRLGGRRRRRPAARAPHLPRVQGAVRADRPTSSRSTSSSAAPPRREFFHGAGCNFCSDTGYHDRVGVYEVLRITDEMRALIVERADPRGDARARRSSEGMRTLREEALRLVAEDVTTIPEILRSVYPL